MSGTLDMSLLTERTIVFCPGYKHDAPPEQRQVSQVSYCLQNIHLRITTDSSRCFLVILRTSS